MITNLTKLSNSSTSIDKSHKEAFLYLSRKTAFIRESQSHFFVISLVSCGHMKKTFKAQCKSYKFLKQTCCGVLSVGRYPPLVNPHDAFGGATATAVSEGGEVKSQKTLD